MTSFYDTGVWVFQMLPFASSTPYGGSQLFPSHVYLFMLLPCSGYISQRTILIPSQKKTKQLRRFSDFMAHFHNFDFGHFRILAPIFSNFLDILSETFILGYTFFWHSFGTRASFLQLNLDYFVSRISGFSLAHCTATRLQN